MIQRIQSVWLLMASVCSFLTFRLSFYFGLKTGTAVNEPLNATSSILLIILAAAAGLSAFISIFLYKDRKSQLRVTVVAIILSLLSLVVYYSQVKNYRNGNLTLTSIIPILIPVILFLAARGIWKDQKLVKSLDRLR